MDKEKVVGVPSGWGMLVLDIVLYLGAAGMIVRGILTRVESRGADGLAWLIPAPFVILAAVLISCGFFMLQPNMAGVMLLFGKYVGTAKREGFCWANPFYTKKKISLRWRNLNGEKLKVNDLVGNPIEIALILVWRVRDTYAATFEVDDYVHYVTTQSESALRHLTSSYPYDSWDHEDEVSLRGNVDEVSHALERELQTRLEKAGVEVFEARLSHLAYAPEIADAMLRRQQAAAIIAARQKIVEGAVGMVKMALDRLAAEKVLELDDERRAAMVSNLLVILCGESHAQPVVNAGTLYT